MDENAAFLFEVMTSCQLWALRAPAVITDCFSADLEPRCKPRGEAMIYLPGAPPEEDGPGQRATRLKQHKEPPQAAE